jgi:hypothetical protein
MGIKNNGQTTTHLQLLARFTCFGLGKNWFTRKAPKYVFGVGIV